MRILVTNDDGIGCEGLRLLAQAVRRHGEVVVVAPDTEYSGASASIGALNRIQPEVARVALPGVDEAWALTAAPALCVTFARLGAFGPPPDLVVSGINPGANVGRAIYHSGTVGAALTARNGGINAIAVSQNVTGDAIEGQAWDEMLLNQRWETAAAVADTVVEALAHDPPREAVLVNLNVPNLPLDAIRGWRRTEIAMAPTRALASAALVPKVGHEGTFHVRMRWGDRLAQPLTTDAGAVENDEVSVTFVGRFPAEEPLTAGAIDDALDGLVPCRTEG